MIENYNIINTNKYNNNTKLIILIQNLSIS